METEGSVLVKEYPDTFRVSQAFLAYRKSDRYRKFKYNRNDFDSDLKYKIIQSLTPDEVFKLFEEKTKVRFEKERLELVKDSSMFVGTTHITRFPCKFTISELYALAKAKSKILNFESRWDHEQDDKTRTNET